MDATAIEALFTRESGEYAFAKWGRPIAPVAFGVTDETLTIIKGALEAVCMLSGHQMAETDPELGSNMMWFFLQDWDELAGVPKLDHLIPELDTLLGRLKAADANQYRIFRFDEAGAIKACFVFLRMDEHLNSVSADTLVLSQVAQSFLLLSDLAFRETSALAVAGETTVLHPDIGEVIRAAYDPVMPVAAQDASHALRLAARIATATQ